MKHPLALGLTLQATAAYAASTGIAIDPEPAHGWLLGYEFDWGPMAAGLLACFAVRFYKSKTEPEHQWSVDAPITALTLLFTAATILNQRPIPLTALLYGTGIGALGVGIIKLAVTFVQRNLDGFGEDADAPDVKPPES